jgi:hypothetical protein
VAVESENLDERIHGLIARAIATSDPAELEITLRDLRAALKEHIRQARTLALFSMPTVSHPKTRE